jgi:hypothetical protein
MCIAVTTEAIRKRVRLPAIVDRLRCSAKGGAALTDSGDLESNARPEIKIEQESYPPRRYDDPHAVAQEEKRFGMSMWIGIAVIGILFLIVLLLFAL